MVAVAVVGASAVVGMFANGVAGMFANGVAGAGMVAVVVAVGVVVAVAVAVEFGEMKRFESINSAFHEKGRVINLDILGTFDEVMIDRCVFDGGGIYILATPGMKITITNCTAVNIQRGSEEHGNFVQVAGPDSSEKPIPIQLTISNNKVVNHPNLTNTEDVINLFNVTGSKDAPLLIEKNNITGSYPYPMDTKTLSNFSGSGIMLDKNTSWAVVRNNVVLECMNAGIGVAGGCFNRINGNIIKTAKGYGQGNVGLYIANQYPKDPFKGNTQINNTISWTRADGTRNDLYIA